MKLVTERISAEAFAPYGTLVRAPSDVGRTAFSDALHKRPNAHVTLSAVECAAEDPAAYRHRHEAPSLSSQTFFPLDVTRYVVLVAPHGAVGMPDMLRARAFMVPGDAAITYAADSGIIRCSRSIGRLAFHSSCGATAQTRTSKPTTRCARVRTLTSSMRA